MLNKILDWIEEIICIICTIVMVTITFANVVCRWTGIGSLAFSEEIATYLFILLSMMGTAIAAKRRAHLGLTILPDAVNFKARKALLVFVYGLCTVFSAAVFYYGRAHGHEPVQPRHGHRRHAVARVDLRHLRPLRRVLHHDTLRPGDDRGSESQARVR